MKKKFTFLITAALMLLTMMARPVTVLGQTRADFEFNLNQLYQNGTLVTVKTVITESGGTLTFTDQDENFTILMTRNSSNQPGFYTSSGYIRFYNSDTFKLSAADGITITKIVVTPNGTNFSLSAMTGLNTSTKTWEGSASEVTFTGSGTNKWDKLTITYTTGGSTTTPTTVTIDASGITNNDVYVGTAAGSLSATVKDNNNTIISGAAVTWNSNNTNVATIDDSGEVTLVAAGTTTITASYAGDATYSSSSATYNLEVVDNTPSSDQWVLTELADLTSTDVFVIVGNNGSNYAMSNDKGTGNPPAAVAVTVSGNNLTGTIANNIQWNISGDATDGYIFYPNGSTTTWLYCTATNNGVRVGTNDAKTFKMVTGYLVHQGTSRYIGIYNSQDWRCYTSINTNIASQTFAFYKKVSGGVVPPSISAENVSIAHDATNGSIAYTVNNGVNGGSISAAVTDGDWLTLGSGTASPISFTCSANTAAERTATVTLTYTYSTRETTTKNVTITQAANPNGPGSQANPYTVAQARAAIDAGTGITGVYSTGIVSAIPTAWSTQFNNITFNFVDNAGDTDFLQAFRCVSGTGVDASEVAVGDIVVVYGNLTKYGSTYEFGQGCQLVSLTHPAVTVEAPTFSPVAGTYADAQTVTISCATAGVDIYYTLDGTVPTMSSDMYDNPIAVNTTTTIKAIAVNGDDVASTVATATYHICSADDPYTVTQALAFLEYPANGIYVEGIVSTAPTQAPTSNGELTYYISVDGDATNQLEVYKGKDLNEAAFTAQDDIQVGDIVTVYGNVVYYGTTLEFASGNYLVYFERPSAPAVPTITVAPALVEATSAETEGNLAITLENIDITETGGGMFDYIICDAEGAALADPSTVEAWLALDFPYENNAFSVYYVISENTTATARTAYFKVYGLGDDGTTEAYSNLITVNQEAYVTPPTPGNWVLTNLADLTTGDIFVIVGNNGANYAMSNDNGTGSAPAAIAVTVASNTLSGTIADNLQWNISGNATDGYIFYPNGETETWLYCTNTNDGVRVGTGNAKHFTLDATSGYLTTTETTDQRYLGIYNSQDWRCYKNTTGNIANQTFAFYKKVVDPNAPEITLSAYSIDATSAETDGNLTVTYKNIATDLGASIYWFESDGTTTTTEPNWMIAEINTTTLNIDYTIEENHGGERYAYFKVYGLDNNGDGVYSGLVTVTQSAYVAPPVLENYALFTGDLVEGDYIIYYNGYAMKNTVASGRLEYAEVTPNNNVIATDNAAIIWHIAPNSTNWTIYSAEANAYAASTGVNNKAQMLADGTDDKALWTVSGTEVYEFVNKYNSEDSKNANLRNNGTYGFACYSTSTGGALTLYKKATNIASYDKTINAYVSNKDHYYLIASPVSANPTNVAGMTEGTFDLYAFDQSQNSEEWRNYEAGAFYLTPGKGYLYAKSEDITLSFNGVPYAGNGQIELDYTDGATLAGWNLIGNPFTTSASLNKPYHRLNPEGSALLTETENTAVAAMEGVFVLATAANQSATFSAQRGGEQSGIAQVDINVICTRGTVIDNAIIRFDEGETLEKFMFNPNNTKIYFTQEGKDYSIIRSNGQGEMPVNFKVAENGTYTFSISAENTVMSYLHLIDNKTGADIDLLTTPSYSFDAKVNDYASRFRLVFSANENETDNEFAFFSNGNLTIYGIQGDATLQVIDVTGRILSTENFSGSYSQQLNAAPGVYMLRLINGSSVMTQKIVIK